MVYYESKMKECHILSHYNHYDHCPQRRKKEELKKPNLDKFLPSTAKDICSHLMGHGGSYVNL